MGFQQACIWVYHTTQFWPKRYAEECEDLHCRPCGRSLQWDPKSWVEVSRVGIFLMSTNIYDFKDAPSHPPRDAFVTGIRLLDGLSGSTFSSFKRGMWEKVWSIHLGAYLCTSHHWVAFTSPWNILRANVIVCSCFWAHHLFFCFS